MITNKLINLINKFDRDTTIHLINAKRKDLFKGKVVDIPEKYLAYWVLEIGGLFRRKQTLTITIVEDMNA